ncbi:MAG: hypothetical protein BYD32DRAFT_429947 [Podila humilis]|nr:MAG: hypothetical protein BYD32DRAFT_429947 [Podila humilis]
MATFSGGNPERDRQDIERSSNKDKGSRKRNTIKTQAKDGIQLRTRQRDQSIHHSSSIHGASIVHLSPLGTW